MDFSQGTGQDTRGNRPSIRASRASPRSQVTRTSPVSSRHRTAGTDLPGPVDGQPTDGTQDVQHAKAGSDGKAVIHDGNVTITAEQPQGSDRSRSRRRRHRPSDDVLCRLRRPRTPGPADRGYLGPAQQQGFTATRTGLQPDGVDAGRLQPAGSRSVPLWTKRSTARRSASSPRPRCGRSRRHPAPLSGAVDVRVRRRATARTAWSGDSTWSTQGDLLDGTPATMTGSAPRRVTRAGHHPDDGGGGSNQQGDESPMGAVCP